MAEKDAAKSAPAAAAAEPPKAVQIGGESILDRLRPHIKQILIGTVVVAVIAGAVAVVSWVHDNKQMAATGKLERVLAVADEPVRGKDEKADPKKPSFASAKERADAVLSEIDKEGGAAGGPAYRGGFLLDAGKVDDAIAEYKKGVADKTIQGVLSREGLGLALEAKAAGEKDAGARQKGYEEALAAFTTMQPDDNGPRAAFALYHQARMQVLLGKRAEAKTLFEKARTVNKDADPAIAEQIEKRLASLGAS
jgi:tetratricopeptide (TPR) repeat protein